MTDKGDKKRPEEDENTGVEQQRSEPADLDSGQETAQEGRQPEGDDPATDASGGGPEPGDDIQEKLASAREELREAQDRVLRVSAEFENYKKRSAREMDAHRKYANESLIKALLPVVDNLELAIRSAKENGKGDEGLLEGIEMTRKEILKVFEKFGVTPVEAEGKPFDPSVHEAAMQESSGTFPENTVIREFQKGYMIQERLLRPSMVVVSKGEDGSKQQ
jgi:molecular chaperone GrpE